MNDDPRSTDRTDPEAELERRLDAYADARLRPDPARMARARVELLIAAREQAASGFAAAQASDAAIGGPAGRRRRWVPALLAATFATALLAGTVAAGSVPGGPLYGVRLWVAQMTLPTEGMARLDAQLRQLQDRLDDATQAANSGNGPAVQAALDAYRQTLAEAYATAGGDLSREDRLALVIGRHLAVLEALAARLPEQASDAIQQAIDRTETKIDQIQSATPNPGGGPGSNPGGPNAKPTPGGPDKTPPGKPTPAHSKTPPAQGGPTATPQPGGGPDRTPPGKPSKTPKP